MCDCPQCMTANLAPEPEWKNPGAPDRARRCRKLDRQLNRCPGLELEDTGLCAEHLARAHRDFVRLTGGKLTMLGARGG